jgi:hypothetical protein
MNERFVGILMAVKLHEKVSFTNLLVVVVRKRIIYSTKKPPDWGGF